MMPILLEVRSTGYILILTRDQQGRYIAMMTIVTTVTLTPAGAEQWDRAMGTRVEAARGRRGWVAAQLLKRADQPLQRAIVGTWDTRVDWEAWHQDETFRETRDQLDGLQVGPADTVWYEVVELP
jgi:heme-degrading monooxygenase HmoA